MAETQSNTKGGDIVLATTADMTGKEGYLIKIANNNGARIGALPAAVTDVVTHVILRVNSPTEIEVRPLSPDRYHRVRLKGAASPGQTLILSNVTWGQVAYAATGAIKCVAMETGVDGQLLLVMPVNLTL